MVKCLLRAVVVRAARDRRCGTVARAFALLEMLVVVVILAVLVGLLLPMLSTARHSSRSAVCASNLVQLASANLHYAFDSDRHFALAARDVFNSIGPLHGGYHRWHGVRESYDQRFDPAKAPLSPYFDGSDRVKRCPTLDRIGVLTHENAYELGNGGYGYNHYYIGARADLHGFSAPAMLQSARIESIGQPDETVMFTDTAFVDFSTGKAGLIEYSFAEPPHRIDGSGAETTGRPVPSIHFRHADQANIAWVDGHLGHAPMTFSHLNRDEYHNGWFGPNSNAWFDLQ